MLPVILKFFIKRPFVKNRNVKNNDYLKAILLFRSYVVVLDSNISTRGQLIHREIQTGHKTAIRYSRK